MWTLITTNPIRKILGDAALPPRLTADEEIALAHRVAAGQTALQALQRAKTAAPHQRRLQAQVADGQAAREALVLHNLPLVVSVVARFRCHALGDDDLIQEGILGLLKAAERYNPDRGTRFGTLAVWWIRQSIGRAIANTGRVIRLPVNRAWKISQLRRIAAQMAQAQGIPPDLTAVAEQGQVSPEAAAELLSDGQDVLSLDAPADSAERAALERVADHTLPDPEEVVMAHNLREIIEESLARLDEREAQIVRLRFGLGGGEARPLRAIAAACSMSPEGARQISERAMLRLREFPKVKALQVYLED
jgi:RNA polymerase sigma factor (sigma-70 family)